MHIIRLQGNNETLSVKILARSSIMPPVRPMKSKNLASPPISRSGIGQIITRSLLLIQKGGPRGTRQKTSKYGPNGLMAKNEDRDPVILSLPF
jgi:hypothetical protein